MARSVQLSEQAYATLTSLKEEGESYSDVVLRIAAARKDPMALLKLRGASQGFDYLEARRKNDELDQRRSEWLDSLRAQRNPGPEYS